MNSAEHFVSERVALFHHCRRLFLRNWRPPGSALESGERGVAVSVEVFVRYENSDSGDDDLANVVDYNVMRDALLYAEQCHAAAFAERALDYIFRYPVVSATVVVADIHSGEAICRRSSGGEDACAERVISASAFVY